MSIGGEFNLPVPLSNHLASAEFYLVGGALRDHLLGAAIKDYDFVLLNCDRLRELVLKMADETNSAFVALDDSFETYRLVNAQWQADISKPRASDIEGDLWCRDLTVNAMAYDYRQHKLIDPTGGLQDLAAKRLRLVRASAIIDDPLRILRVYRLAGQLSFEIDKLTHEQLRLNAKLASCAAAERTSGELWQIMSLQEAHPIIVSMANDGILESLIPEFASLREVPANSHHHLPLWEHTLELIHQLENHVLPALPKDLELNIRTRKTGLIDALAVIRVACLLHDISKPETWQIEGDKHTFYQHELLGAVKVKQIGNRLCWPKAVIADVSNLVRLHLRPFQVASPGVPPTDRAVRKLFREAGAILPSLLVLAWADMLSTRGKAVSQLSIDNGCFRLLQLWQAYKKFIEQEKTVPPLLRGEQLVAAIGEARLPPTAAIKNLLAELRELQLSEAITTTEEAQRWFVRRGLAIGQEDETQKYP